MATDNAKELINLEIQEINTKLSNIDKSCKSLDEKFVNLIMSAEKNKDVVMVAEANVLKRKSQEQIEERKKLEGTLSIMKEKHSKL